MLSLDSRVTLIVAQALWNWLTSLCFDLVWLFIQSVARFALNVRSYLIFQEDLTSILRLLMILALWIPFSGVFTCELETALHPIGKWIHRCRSLTPRVLDQFLRSQLTLQGWVVLIVFGEICPSHLHCWPCGSTRIVHSMLSLGLL